MRRKGELLRALFALLIESKDGLKAKDAIAGVAKRVTLSDYEAGEFPSGGGRRFDKILRFTTIDAVKAGWMVKVKGHWTITDAGRDAYARFRDPDALHHEAFRLFREWKSHQASTPEPDDEVTSDADSAADTAADVSVTYEQADEDAWAEIERHLTTMQPYEFQQLVAGLLTSNGWSNYGSTTTKTWTRMRDGGSR